MRTNLIRHWSISVDTKDDWGCFGIFVGLPSYFLPKVAIVLVHTVEYHFCLDEWGCFGIFVLFSGEVGWGLEGRG